MTTPFEPGYDPDFDAKLDAHHARLIRDAEEEAVFASLEARRPDAERLSLKYAELRIGDFITAEVGPDARWVEVVAVEPEERDTLHLAVTFKVTRPLGLGLHDRFTIYRPAGQTVFADGKLRAERRA